MASFAYANQQASGPRPPGGWSPGQSRGSATIVPDSRGALDEEISVGASFHQRREDGSAEGCLSGVG